MALWCICLLPAELRAAEAPAWFDFDLPAARLAEALERFNAQSGGAAGMEGPLPEVRTQAVAGRYTALAALRRMLAGSGLSVRPAGPLSFRLERAPAVPAVDAMPQTPAEVRITAARDRNGRLDRPLAVTVAGAAELAGSAALPGMGEALDFDAATSSTHLGPGRNRDFIRGVADSAFPGSSQATVGIALDEAPLNYNAPDPDLRLPDVERVEILKGPQPLEDTGALGGIVRIVPQRPDLTEPLLRAAVLAGDTAHGGFSPGGSGVINLPLVAGVLGVRAVAYAQQDAGWIDNTGGRSDANRTRLAGGRAMLRGEAAGWRLDLQGAGQRENVADSQYVPGDAPPLTRSGVLPEPRDNDVWLLSGLLSGPLWGGELRARTSYARQEVAGIEDASAAAAWFGAVAPLRYHDERAYELVSSELRYTGGGPRLTWQAGVVQRSARSRIAGALDPPPAAGATVEDLRQDSRELALFGEVAAALPAQLRLTAGVRLARLSDEDQSRAGVPQALASVMHTATPSVALAWQSVDERRLVYLRYAQAARPGGLNPDGAPGSDPRFRSDALSNLDAGVRLSGGPLTLQAAVFASRWWHVQSDYLLDNGLIGTRNAGNAGNLGVETQLRVAAAGGWSADLGGVLQHARLEDAAVPMADEDPRLPVVPDVRVYAGLSRDLSLGGWQLRLQARGDYRGSSRLSFDPGLDRETPGSFTLGAGARLVHGRYELQLNATNLLDSHADTFAFGNPFSIRAGPQRTPLPPRTITLQLAGTW